MRSPTCLTRAVPVRRGRGGGEEREEQSGEAASSFVRLFSSLLCALSLCVCVCVHLVGRFNLQTQMPTSVTVRTVVPVHRLCHALRVDRRCCCFSVFFVHPRKGCSLACWLLIFAVMCAYSLTLGSACEGSLLLKSATRLRRLVAMERPTAAANPGPTHIDRTASFFVVHCDCLSLFLARSLPFYLLTHVPCPYYPRTLRSVAPLWRKKQGSPKSNACRLFEWRRACERRRLAR